MKTTIQAELTSIKPMYSNLNHFQKLLLHTFNPWMNFIFLGHSVENYDLKKIRKVISSSKTHLRVERLIFLSSWGEKELEKTAHEII